MFATCYYPSYGKAPACRSLHATAIASRFAVATGGLLAERAHCRNVLSCG